MVLLQLAAASIIPVVAVCLRNPTPSIAFATLMVAIYFCLVIFLAHFIQIMRGGKNSSSKVVFSFLLQAFVFLVFLGIVAGVVIMYLRFVQAGSSTSSVTGIILSLVPTIGISAVSWFAKRQLFSEQKDDSSEDTKTGIAKYTARFAKIFGSSTKLDTIQQDLLPAPSGEVQSADDAAAAIPTYALEYAESDNSADDTETVSLNLEPNNIATESPTHDIECKVVTVDFQPTEPIDDVVYSNEAAVETNL